MNVKKLVVTNEMIDGREMSGGRAKRAPVRTLGRLETMYHTYHKKGIDMCAQVVHLDCVQCVTLSQVREAMERLQMQHPMLRMFIDEDTEHRFHFVERNSRSVDCSVSYLSTEDLLKEALNKKFLADGPLWRIIIQKTRSIIQENGDVCSGCQISNKDRFLHNFSFALSFHHSLIDGMYLVCLLRDFLEILQNIQLNEEFNSSKDLEQREILPPIEHFLQPVSWRERSIFVPTRSDIKQSMDALTAYERCFFSEIGFLRLKPERTEALRLNMDRTKSFQFLSNCKQQHILVSGAIMAAASIAFAKRLKKSLQPTVKILDIPVDVMVDMRRYTTEPMKDFPIFPGTAAMHLYFLVKVPLQENLDSQTLFWRIAKKCSADMTSALDSSKPLRIMREEVECEIDTVGEGVGKSAHVLCITNLNSVDRIVRPDEHPCFQLKGFTGLSKIGIDNHPVFEILVFSLNDRLHLDTAYCSGYTSGETAANFSWTMIQTIQSTSML